MAFQEKTKILNDFAAWVQLSLEDPRTKFILGQLIDNMEKLCEECQADRLRCTFDPMCEDRRWLSLLIEVGVPRRFWPKFCFSRRSEEIKNLLSRKSTPTPLIDAKFPLSDFLKLFLKDMRGKVTLENIDNYVAELVEFLKKKWEKVDTLTLSSKKRVIILDVHRSVLILDPVKKVATINAQKTGLDSKEEYLELITSILSTNNFEYKIINPYYNTYYLYLYVSDKALDVETLKRMCEEINIKFWTQDGKAIIMYAIRFDQSSAFPPTFHIDHVLSIIKCLKSTSLEG